MISRMVDTFCSFLPMFRHLFTRLKSNNITFAQQKYHAVEDSISLKTVRKCALTRHCMCQCNRKEPIRNKLHIGFFMSFRLQLYATSFFSFQNITTYKSATSDAQSEVTIIGILKYASKSAVTVPKTALITLPVE